MKDCCKKWVDLISQYKFCPVCGSLLKQPKTSDTPFEPYIEFLSEPEYASNHWTNYYYDHDFYRKLEIDTFIKRLGKDYESCTGALVLWQFIKTCMRYYNCDHFTVADVKKWAKQFNLDELPCGVSKLYQGGIVKKIGKYITPWYDPSIKQYRKNHVNVYALDLDREKWLKKAVDSVKERIEETLKTLPKQLERAQTFYDIILQNEGNLSK